MSSSNNSSKKSDDVLTQDIINDAIKVIQERERYKPDTLYMPRNHLKQMLKEWEELEKKEKHLKKSNENSSLENTK